MRDAEVQEIRKMELGHDFLGQVGQTKSPDGFRHSSESVATAVQLELRVVRQIELHQSRQRSERCLVQS